MKTTLCFVAITFLSLRVCKAQDSIFTHSGAILLAKVFRVGSNELEYKKWANQEGPVYVILLSDVDKILYENGTSETFESAGVVSQQTVITHRLIIVAGNKYFWENGYLIEPNVLAQTVLNSKVPDARTFFLRSQKNKTRSLAFGFSAIGFGVTAILSIPVATVISFFNTNVAEMGLATYFISGGIALGMLSTSISFSQLYKFQRRKAVGFYNGYN